MRILVTHLTRMGEQRICVAGLTREGVHVRPCDGDVELQRKHLRINGGLFEIAAVVELGEVEEIGIPPEVEDRSFRLTVSSFEFALDPETYWKFLLKHTQAGLREIFGPDLRPVGATMTLPLGRGLASLGAFRPDTQPVLFRDDRGKIRARLNDRGKKLQIPVTDIRLYREDGSPRDELMAWLNRAVEGGCVLCVGVGRPYKTQARPEEEHWLQVNNIHPQSDPLWRTAPNTAS
ncbi:MAG TPA: hypothetical protein VG815_15810 [Chloroflexota bacterium]|jgi:hypothetical protein|nr:hypothetical protein [Chloroflexota bacterium]